MKEEYKYNLIIAVIMVAIMVGGSWVFAHFVYHDWRCIFAQCRLLK